METKNWNLFLAVLWTFVLLMNIGACITGSTPSWITHLLFTAYITLDMWTKYLEEKYK